MAVPLSQDLRKRLFRAVEEGSSARGAAARFEISASAAVELMGRVRERAARSRGRSAAIVKPLLEGHEDLLCELTASRKGIRLAEILDALVARGITLGSLTTIWSTLSRLGLSHNKRT